MRPVELALRIVELLSSHQPLGVSELSRLADIPKSTAQRSLKALQKAGWVEAADPTQRLWSLTMQAVLASGRAGQRQSGLRNIALPVMEELRRATGETIHLTYRFRRSIVVVERLDGIKPVRHFLAYGAVYALHATASGKSILSQLPQEDLDTYLALPLEAITPRTVTEVDALRTELAHAREQGFAVTLGGNILDVHAVGSAIRDYSGIPIAAVSISAPAERLSNDLLPEFGALIADAARRISLGGTPV